MEKNRFTELDSFNVINEMINTARGNLRKGAGKYFILWGYIVVITSLVHFFINKLNISNASQSGNIWLVSFVLGIIFSIIFIVRDRKTSIVQTYTDKIVGYTWVGFVFSIIFIGFFLNGKYGLFIYPAITFMYTFALYISGAAYKFKWMFIFVGISFVCTVLYKFIPTAYYPLPMAVAILGGNIISGHILNYKAKKHV